MRTPASTVPLLPRGFGFPLGFACGILVTAVTIAAGATSHPARSLIALTVVVAVVSAITTPGAALGTAVACWALDSGFVLGREGTLVFTGAARETAAVLVLAAVTVAALSRAVRGPGGPWTGKA
jgi:hypothetical protein